jgi:hypothetical protein
MKDPPATPIWMWLNVVSLDAPLIALIWQDFLMRCYPVPLRAPARWVLLLTVWAIYITDRLLDVRHPAAPGETLRHRFYRLHRPEMAVLLALVLLADLLIALVGLRTDVFLNGLFIAAGVLLYLALFALWRVGVNRWKHPAAAVLFTIGIFLVDWTRTASPARLLAFPAAVFCGLCLGNLALQENWERYRPTPRIWLPMAILIAACVALGNSRWYAAVAVSASGLAVLNFRGVKLEGNLRHILADAALLSPLLFR